MEDTLARQQRKLLERASLNAALAEQETQMQKVVRTSTSACSSSRRRR